MYSCKPRTILYLTNPQVQLPAVLHLVLDEIPTHRHLSQMIMLTTLSFLLAALPLLLSEPICSDPPPPPSYIPNLTHCHHLVDWIFAISKLQHDEPILWSRNPSAFVRNRKLPYYFTDPLASQDCVFIVDTLHEGDYDTFPTYLVAEQAENIVKKCMERGIDGAETVGAVAVGPKHVLAVILVREPSTRGSVGRERLELNMTNVTLMGTGNSSGLSPPFVEDG